METLWSLEDRDTKEKSLGKPRSKQIAKPGEQFVLTEKKNNQTLHHPVMSTAQRSLNLQMLYTIQQIVGKFFMQEALFPNFYPFWTIDLKIWTLSWHDFKHQRAPPARPHSPALHPPAALSPGNPSDSSTLSTTSIAASPPVTSVDPALPLQHKGYLSLLSLMFWDWVKNY